MFSYCCGCCPSSQERSAFFIKNSFFVFLCGQLLQRCSQFRLNRLRSALRHVSQAHFSKSGVQQKQLFKRKGKRDKAAPDGKCRFNRNAGMRVSESRRQPLFSDSAWERWEQLAPFSLCPPHPRPAPLLPSPLPRVSIPQLPKPGSQCAAGPTDPQPATS